MESNTPVRSLALNLDNFGTAREENGDDEDDEEEERTEGGGIDESEEAPGGGIEESKEEEKEDEALENTENSETEGTSQGVSYSTTTMEDEVKNILIDVCAFPNTNHAAYKAVDKDGLHTVQDFLACPYDRTFTYKVSGTDTALQFAAQQKLSQILAYGLHLAETNHADADNPANWTKDNFNTWRRGSFAEWKTRKEAAAAAAAAAPAPAPAPTSVFAVSNREKYDLDAFNKHPKSITEYTVFKDESKW